MSMLDSIMDDLQEIRKMLDGIEEPTRVIDAYIKLEEIISTLEDYEEVTYFKRKEYKEE